MHPGQLLNLFGADFFLAFPLDEFVAVIADLLGEHAVRDDHVLKRRQVLLRT